MSDSLQPTPWAVARQAPLTVGFSRQEYWSGLHALLQGIFLTQGLSLHLMSPALADRFFTTSATWECVRFVLPSVVHLLSHVRLCDPMDYSTSCSPVLHCLLELA